MQKKELKLQFRTFVGSLGAITSKERIAKRRFKELIKKFNPAGYEFENIKMVMQVGI